jgi:hypothetical protein
MTFSAIQRNGERLRLEEGIVRAWREGRLRDPMLLNILDNAVAIRESDWPW